MRVQRIVISLLIVMIARANFAADDGLDPAVLEKVKAATVFLKTNNAGDSMQVQLALTPKAFAVYRDGDYEQVVEPGVREVWVGGGQPGQSAGLAGNFTIAGPPQTPLALCGEAAAAFVRGKL